TVNFKIMTEPVGWNDDFGAEKDESLVLTINDDFVSTHSRKNEGIGGAGPGNIVLKDLAEGQTYRVHVKYDSSANTAQIRVTGNVTDYPNLRVVIGEDDLSMTREGSTYTYLYTPEEDGSFDYYITNGYLYWDNAGEITDESGKEVYTLDYVYDKWADGSVKQYFIRVDASSLPKIKVTDGIYDSSILGKTGFAGDVPGFDWNGNILLSDYKIDETTYEYPFTAKAETYKFAIQKTPGVWGGCYGGRANDADGDCAVIKPSDSKATKMVARNKDSAETNMVIEGLSYGSEYKLVITIDGSDVYAQVVLTKEVVAKYSFEGLTLKGGWEGWWSDTKVLTSDATQTFVTSVGENDADGNEWGIFPDGASNNWYVENLVLGTRTEMTYTPSNGTNSTMKENWEVNATYTIKVELTDDSVTAPKAFVTITKNE
ncbi:MAG: hypothetical protein IJ727_06410, partial [Treponema sp.]|nr:hypothetical protein [Treponema sp.]